MEIYSRKREYVYRPPGCRYSEKYITKTVKYGGNCLIVLGAIKEDGTILIRCPDWINSVGYEDVLKRGLLAIYEAHNIFQQNGAHAINPELLLLFLTIP